MNSKRGSMNYQNKVWVFDDVVERSYQDEIESTLLGSRGIFNWYFIDDMTSKGDNKLQSRPGFNHQFTTESGVCNSPWHEMMVRMIDNSCDKIGYKYDKILNGRAFLQLPLNIKDRDILDTPHTDSEHNHLVVLYYVKDADGDTIIFNNHYESEKMITSKNQTTIKKTVKPKKGRVVMFDGWLWHTAQLPSDETRCVINYNVI